jgi:hypothetical protein
MKYGSLQQEFLQHVRGWGDFDTVKALVNYPTISDAVETSVQHVRSASLTVCKFTKISTHINSSAKS